MAQQRDSLLFTVVGLALAGGVAALGYVLYQKWQLASLLQPVTSRGFVVPELLPNGAPLPEGTRFSLTRARTFGMTRTQLAEVGLTESQAQALGIPIL